MHEHVPNWDMLKIKTEFAVNDRNDQVAKNNFKNSFVQGDVRYTQPLSALIFEAGQCAFYDVYMKHPESYKIGFYQHARFSWFKKVNTSRVPAGHCHPTYLLPVLLSEHKELIHWYAQYIFPHCSIGHGNDKIYYIPGSFEHRSYTLMHAIIGNWEQLQQEAERGVSVSGEFVSDYQFMLGLATRNMLMMEQALVDIVSGKQARERCDDVAFGLIREAMNGWGLLYSKIAWWHGIEVVIDNSWIPDFMLPVNPLPAEQYTTGIDIVDDLDIFTTLRDASADSQLCKFASIYTPKPLGETLDIPRCIEEEASLLVRAKAELEFETPTDIDDDPEAVSVYQHSPDELEQVTKQLHQKSAQLVETVLANRGFTIHSGGQLSDGSGFEHVVSAKTSSGDYMVMIVSSRVALRDSGFQLEFDVDSNMQFSPAWIDRIMKRLPDDSEAKQAIQKADVLRTVVGGIDEVTDKMEFVVVDANDTEK